MIFEFKEVIQCVEIFITDDDAYEQVEEFSVLLSNPSQDTTLGVAQSTVMITDNDSKCLYVIPSVISYVIKHPWLYKVLADT